MNLELIAPALRAAAVEDLERGNALGFISRSEWGNTHWLAIVHRNASALKGARTLRRGAPSGMGRHSDKPCSPGPCPTGVSVRVGLKRSSERTVIRYPDRAPFTLYRGVAGIGARRRPRGLSWTASFDCAAWFARRYSLPKAVLRIDVEASDVLAYLTGRGEEEFVIALPPGKRPAIQTRDRAGRRWQGRLRTWIPSCSSASPVHSSAGLDPRSVVRQRSLTAEFRSLLFAGFSLLSLARSTSLIRDIGFPIRLGIPEMPAATGAQMPTMWMNTEPVFVEVSTLAVGARDVLHLVAEYRRHHVVNRVQLRNQIAL